MKLVSTTQLEPVAEHLYDAAVKVRHLRWWVESMARSARQAGGDDVVRLAGFDDALESCSALEEEIIVAMGRLRMTGVPVLAMPAKEVSS